VCSSCSGTGGYLEDVMAKFRTHYDNLQVSENASIEVIRGAYKYLSQKWHPDRNPDDRERAAKIMRIINDAYAILSVSEKRKGYDEWIKSKRGGVENNDEEFEDISQEGPTEFNDKQNSSSDYPKYEEKYYGGALHPWRRYFARYLDISTSGMILLLAYLWYMIKYHPNTVDNYSTLFGLSLFTIPLALWVLIEAFFITHFSTTPAKWIFGIYISKPDGSNLDFEASFSRSIQVFIKGLGLGIPIIFLITNYYGYKRLLNTGTTLWDNDTNSVVSHSKWGVLRVIVIIPVIVLGPIAASAIIDDLTDKQSNGYSDYSISKKLSIGVGSGQGNFEIENRCNQSVSLIIKYKPLNGDWKTEGWWIIEPKQKKVLSQNGIRLKSENVKSYYYAETNGLEGSKIVWEGDHLVYFQNNLYQMTELNDPGGNGYWAATCDK